MDQGWSEEEVGGGGGGCPPLVCLRAENSSRGLKDCRTIRVLRLEEVGEGAREGGRAEVGEGEKVMGKSGRRL